MSENPNQPREYDAVLGGDSQPPTNAAVLGGLEGVKRRFDSTVEAQRILALNDALNYGELGLDFVIQALHDKSGEIKWAAYSLLLDKTEAKVKIALQKYNPYQFFECLHTLRGTEIGGIRFLEIAPDGKTIISSDGDDYIKGWDLPTGK
ncbi:MAG: WD40 repeat domain-containing protein, partial [Cyanobacteriota bacterium]